MRPSNSRDPDTGKLTAWGYTERVARIAAILLIPILLWAVRVEVFIQAGPRFTEEDARALVLTMREEWRVELKDAVKDGQLPIADLRLTRLEEDVASIRKTVSDNRASLTAIQILLQER